MYLPERKLALIQKIANTQDEVLISTLEQYLEGEEAPAEQAVEYHYSFPQAIEPFEEYEAKERSEQGSEPVDDNEDRQRFFFGKTR